MQPHALLDLSLTAVIDWVEFTVTLRSPSQFRHVQARAQANGWGVPWVTELSRYKFNLRRQDPHRPSTFMCDVQALRLPTDLPITEADIVITAVEVAVDARHPFNDVDALAVAAAHLKKHLARPPSAVPRITEPDHYRASMSPADDLQALRNGLSINFGKSPNLKAGERGDDHRVRVYVKTHDSLGGERYQMLKPQEYRARLENSLQGTCLPFSTIAEWRSFRFETLTKRFNQVRAIGGDTNKSLAIALQSRASQLGKPLRQVDAARPVGAVAESTLAGYRNLRRPLTRRDTPLNRRIYDALRELTRKSSVNFAETEERARAQRSQERGSLHDQSPKYLNRSSEVRAGSKPAAPADEQAGAGEANGTEPGVTS